MEMKHLIPISKRYFLEMAAEYRGGAPAAGGPVWFFFGGREQQTFQYFEVGRSTGNVHRIRQEGGSIDRGIRGPGIH